MALTIEQIQENITNKGDAREIINQMADYIQANPSSPGGGSSYLVYAAILSQPGTDAPTASVLENTLGLQQAWTRFNDGSFEIIEPSAPFTIGKTVILTGPADQNANYYYTAQRQYDATDIAIFTYNVDHGNTVDMFGTLFIEIRVYP